jgi:hypothetical protein
VQCNAMLWSMIEIMIESMIGSMIGIIDWDYAAMFP